MMQFHFLAIFPPEENLLFNDWITMLNHWLIHLYIYIKVLLQCFNLLIIGLCHDIMTNGKWLFQSSTCCVIKLKLHYVHM